MAKGNKNGLSKQQVMGVITSKKIPIVTLDERWHQLFPSGKKTFQIRRLEEKLNQLLKEQGRLVNDAKSMKKLKNQLMNEIVQNMCDSDQKSEESRLRTLARNQKMITELNEKLKNTDNELEAIPKKIKACNEELVYESVRVSYDQIAKDLHKIKELNDWIEETRNKLKEKLVIKQELEESNNVAYTYLHDMLGANVMEGIDQSNGQERID